MSRHKLIKNLDLEDELDDFDGGDDYAEDGATEGSPALSNVPGCALDCGSRSLHANIMLLQSSAKRIKVCYPSTTPHRRCLSTRLTFSRIHAGRDDRSTCRVTRNRIPRHGQADSRDVMALLLRYPEDGGLSDEDICHGQAGEGEES